MLLLRQTVSIQKGNSLLLNKNLKIAKGFSMKRLQIILISLILFLNVNAFEKVGTTSFQFLKVITTARAAAMGGAYTSIAINSDAIFWNPSAISDVGNFSASFGYVDWFMDVGHYSFSAAYTIDGIGTFGLSGMMSDVGDIQVTRVSELGFVGSTYNPGLTGEVFSPKAQVVGLTFAKALNDRFSFGITAKYAYEDLVYESTGVLMFDGGLRFKTNYKSIVLGASLRNFGPEVKFIDESYPLPQTLTIGISSYLFSPDDPLLANSHNHSLLVSYDISQPRDYDQQHAFGMEYNFNDMIYLRGGYLFNGDQEGFSAGLGLNYKGYQVDYSFSDYGEYLDSVHRVTIGLNLN